MRQAGRQAVIPSLGFLVAAYIYKVMVNLIFVGKDKDSGPVDKQFASLMASRAVGSSPVPDR